MLVTESSADAENAFSFTPESDVYTYITYPPAWIMPCSIYITHLHGDHCFGIGATIQSIDTAKRQHQEADRNSDSGPSVTHVWGPPGTAELIKSQLVLTGEEGYKTSQPCIAHDTYQC